MLFLQPGRSQALTHSGGEQWLPGVAAGGVCPVRPAASFPAIRSCPNQPLHSGFCPVKHALSFVQGAGDGERRKDTSFHNDVLQKCQLLIKVKVIHCITGLLRVCP